MTSQYAKEVQEILANQDVEENNRQPKTEPHTERPDSQLQEPIQDIYVFIVREKEEDEEDAQVIDSTATTAPDAQARDTQKPSYPHIYALSVVYLVLLLSILTVQLWLLLNPPIVTITIVAQSQQITLTGTLQLGRVIAPITLTQSQTVPTTGKGHRDARSATGFITFFNGQFQSATVPAGTTVTGSDGVAIVTDQTAYIPAERQTIPPTLGQATVSAHALTPGVRGNIATGDVNQRCCAPSLLAQNTAPFHGGADERDFRTVTTHDLNEVATSLKTTLAQSMQAALQSQVQSGEALLTPACPPTVTADHQLGEEAVHLHVTVSETCSAVAYNSQELKGKVTDLLTRQAVQTLGTGYSLLGDIQVTVKQATITHPTTVFLSYVSEGTWVYALTSQEQHRLKELIAGKSKRNALQLLQSLPGIQSASIVWNENTKLPNDINAIHFVILVEA